MWKPIIFYITKIEGIIYAEINLRLRHSDLPFSIFYFWK